jgi:hypothetical protein
MDRRVGQLVERLRWRPREGDEVAAARMITEAPFRLPHDHT